MATDYPVTFDIDRPEKFERPHIFLRIIVAVVAYFIGGWILGLLYLAFPVLAAIFVSQKGPEKYLQEDGPRMTGWLRWLVAFYAYMGILTDRFPMEKPEEIVRLDVQTGGRPTVGSALLRLIYSIPSAFVLGILSIASGIIWLIAAVFVLIQESYPESLYNFQRGVLRWEARLLGYHASLVDRYPPFALDMEPETATAMAAAPPAAEPSPPAPTESPPSMAAPAPPPEAPPPQAAEAGPPEEPAEEPPSTTEEKPPQPPA